jgi:hypothetical protein
MKVLVVGLEKDLPDTYATPYEITTGGIVGKANLARQEIKRAIAALHEPTAEDEPPKGVRAGLRAWFCGART